jgi:hypothetical protein
MTSPWLDPAGAKTVGAPRIIPNAGERATKVTATDSDSSSVTGDDVRIEIRGKFRRHSFPRTRRFCRSHFVLQLSWNGLNSFVEEFKA